MQDRIDMEAYRRAQRQKGEARSHGQSEYERAEKLRRLKEQIRAGTYCADIKDIAMQLAAAMDPMS
ncbi:Anti-sigma-28 factor, FlgM [Paucidesulfovibrio gracilis DSM 16080]|uniref:Anti-sigma-28 factor, FlgM n=1 Tax=Paucidesulfovibrio gracilis DSM 16080 TaxID=1121449 RepID=A0A1T4X775_9BACT|nr:flagellar biosynthesis anti-sigma factor FlgM [Paucidesulfovibrio gracilis]SKA85484.1 Anti-sigma-28 factor, FlgM [Paucidesulfovibrio gracilis DSM 16080]